MEAQPMRRSGSATKIVWLAAAIVFIGAGAFGVWWWKGQENPVETQIVADATDAVSVYFLENGHPKLGNFERISGAGFDHARYGNPEKRVLRADRLAHFTNGYTNENGSLELIILIVPPGDDGNTSKAAVKSIEEDGHKIIVTHPNVK
jgi:hypothetical protein